MDPAHVELMRLAIIGLSGIGVALIAGVTACLIFCKGPVNLGGFAIGIGAVIIAIAVLVS